MFPGILLKKCMDSMYFAVIRKCFYFVIVYYCQFEMVYDFILQECAGKLNRYCWGAVLIPISYIVEDKHVLQNLLGFGQFGTSVL
jgi:hypothetical protein